MPSEDPPPRPCSYRGRGPHCNQPGTSYLPGFPGDFWFCQTHFLYLLRDAYLTYVDLVRDAREAQDEHNKIRERLERVKPTVAEVPGRGWGYSYRLPRSVGNHRRRRSGFATKQEAQSASKAALAIDKETVLKALACGEPVLEIADGTRRDAWRRQEEADKAVRQKRADERRSEAEIRRYRERQRIVYYVTRPDGAVKIGTTWNLESRMQAFRSVAPCELITFHTGGQPAEAALHRRFRGSRLDGEWFTRTPALDAHLAHVLAVTGRRRSRG